MAPRTGPVAALLNTEDNRTSRGHPVTMSATERRCVRTDDDWVRAFVGAHPGLSALGRREALKHL